MDKKQQRDFTNVAEKDCVRLIIAQDLKEFGIDVDTNLGGGLGNLTATSSSQHRNAAINTSSNLNGTASSHFQNMHNHSLSVHHCATLGSNLKDFITHGSSSKHSNKLNVSTQLIGDRNSIHENQVTTRVFNLHMSQVELTSATILEQCLNVPIFLKNSVEFLNDLIHVEGIFRRNGTASRLKELKKQVEEGIYNFEKFAVFDVTSLFKQFFRELPESLLTFALYTNFIQAVKLETTKSKLESILNLCLQLPELNLNVLIYLMNFLKRVTLQESSNKMNSFNLAVCFAPNIIYTKVSKCNDLYINEERIVVQLLIENSSAIGKVSDSVYERSLMLNSLCCSTTMMNNANNTTSLSQTATLGSTGDPTTGSNPTASVSMNINPTSCKQNSTTMVNNDLLFLYDNDLQENSFAHHGQSAGSTSLSSYCGSSSSKKEKKKRRSSSLKELMNTIQNSISKFRRRSASEKNDKTTCSIITCSSIGNGISSISSTGAGDLSCSSRICYDEKQRFLCDSQVPYIAGSKQMMATPICASLYATPRINKRNAEDSLQSTTKKKLMEKLPQRNLLLPNAPITPFSTTKKSKHPFKQLLSTSEASSASKTSSSSQAPVIGGKSSKSTDELSGKVVSLVPQTPHTVQKAPTTPSTLTAQSVAPSGQGERNNPAIISLQKQLKYDESPSSSLKLKMEKNSGMESHDCRRRLEMLPSTKHHLSSCSSTTSSSRSHHHHHHHREHRDKKNRAPNTNSFTATTSSKHRNPQDPYYHHRNANSSAQHHHYVNAIPSPSHRYTNASSNSSTNRYINQSDLCTKIISSSYMPVKSSSTNKDTTFSSSSGSSTASSTATDRDTNNQKHHNHTSACCGAENSKLAAERSAIDSSMRCTLRRGRPNTPKTGLNVDYRIRKSSVPNTPECTHLAASRVNHTISSDDYKHISGDDFKKNLTSYLQTASLSSKAKSKSNVVVNLSSSSLNTAMVAADTDDPTSSRSKLNPAEASLNESNSSRLLDMAFNEDDLIDDSDDLDDATSKASNLTTTSSDQSSCSLKSKTRKLSKSLSLSNLPDSIANESNVNTTSVSDTSYPLVPIKKSLSETLGAKSMFSNENLLQACTLEEKQPEPIELTPEATSPAIASEPKVNIPSDETFKFKIPDALEENQNLLENVLRRQSLFKLKDKMNGKVSKQINEIERRKLSPYRFSNSPLKAKRAKEHTSGLGSHAKRTELPVSKLTEIPEEQYVVKATAKNKPVNKLSTALATSTVGTKNNNVFKKIDQNSVQSPTMVRVAGLANKFFYKKFNKSRNVKRLNATTNSPFGGMASSEENCCPNRSLQVTGSPMAKKFTGSWECSNESVDL